MDVEMETSPSYFDPEDLTIRERYRRYGKRNLTSSISPRQESDISKFNEATLLYDGQNTHSPTNAILLLENIKPEVESFEVKQSVETLARTQSKRKLSIDPCGIPQADVGSDSMRWVGSVSLKSSKIEDESLADSGETSFALFVSLLDSTLQGLMPIPDLILRFERSGRDVSELIRYGSNIPHRFGEDKMMRQKAQLLLDEAATWSLLWPLYGKGNASLTSKSLLEFIFIFGDLWQSPPTSHLEACQFVVNDHTAQLCLCIVQWLEQLASKALDLESKVRGSHVGTYLPNSGVWYHTQRFLRKGVSAANTVHHLDFDAPTREHAHLLPDGKKQDESLSEDILTLLRAGRIEEACDLCQSAGQPWRAATLCPFGGLDLFSSVEALKKNGKIECCKPLNWKMALVTNGAFGNGLPIVHQR
ncbi:hypothetical protein SLEP1_g54549 [Rubroshorea leprosula]|nr:hypothetical protein SLEP1_g54549 [Rubroshorea leprosula]